MKISPFAVEEWMNELEDGARYNIAETCCDSVSISELFDICNIDKTKFFEDFSSKRLTYGAIEGSDSFKNGICGLYKTIKPEHITITHGAAGANHHVFYSLIEPGDRVISIMPTYQQLYSIPESYGADLQLVKLTESNGYLPDIDTIRELADDNTKLICINNPNNPTGAIMDEEYLKQIIDVAKQHDSYILCDEVYRHLTQEDNWSVSIADLYDKGISVSSMSKVFSLAGLRLGWIATHDEAANKSFMSHRDYNLISCGMFDDAIAGIALSNSNKLLDRNKTLVRNNLAILDKWVSEEKHVYYVKPQAGTTALVYYDFDIDSYELCRDMYDRTGAFVTPGDCFEQPHSMRIGYACDEETLVNGLAAMSEYFRTIE